MKVLIASRIIGTQVKEPIKLFQNEGIEVTYLEEPITEERLIQKVKGIQGMVVGDFTITKRVMEAGKDLKVISKVGVGVDKIDVEAASKMKIWVTNTPGANADAVADLTFGLMLAIARHIPQSLQAVKKGEWPKFQGRQLWEKTLGIIGVGAIGKRVALRAKGFSMRILGYDINKDNKFARENSLNYVELDTLFKESDYVTLHVPLIPETEGLINKETLSLMKPTAYLINIARGGVVKSNDLYLHLKEGKIAGAALDVLEEEPPKMNDPLLTLDNVIITSHIGAFTVESMNNMGRISARNIISVLKGQHPLYSVNKFNNI